MPLEQERLHDLRSLDGKNILITSGPTRGYIDAVRYISNKSTGALGAAIAIESLKRDAVVTFVYGTGSAIPNTDLLSKNHASRFTPIEVETIDDLLTVVQQTVKGKPFNAIIHAMAVLDYIPEKQSSGKISSNQDKLTVTLLRTPKVIKLIRTLWPQAYLVGFKLEVGLSDAELIARAYTSLQENRADLVVANNQNEIAGGKHYAYLINAKKEVESRCETKQEISVALMDLIALKC